MSVREKKAGQEFTTLAWCIFAMLIVEKLF
jgi:hypothetical protein